MVILPPAGKLNKGTSAVPEDDLDVHVASSGSDTSLKLLLSQFWCFSIKYCCPAAAGWLQLSADQINVGRCSSGRPLPRSPPPPSMVLLSAWSPDSLTTTIICIILIRRIRWFYVVFLAFLYILILHYW